MNTLQIACFGELLLRLTTTEHQLLAQADQLQLYCGGAEANVAVSLARAGHGVSMISVLPANALGQRVREELRRHRVDTSLLQECSGRMGLYFLTPGAAQRPAEVIYDRAYSAFAQSAVQLLSPVPLLQNIDWLHVSGVTSALGADLSELTERFLQAAIDKGARTSFDCNFRAKLWKTWNGDAGAAFRRCAGLATVLFADARSLALLLGYDHADNTPAESFAALSQQAMQQFASLQYIVCTQRIEHHVSHHELGARLRSRSELIEITPVGIQPIVDRIGTGDAFSAGFLHGLLSGQSTRSALAFALAAGVIKHTIPGDFNLASLAQIEQVRDAGSVSVQR